MQTVERLANLTPDLVGGAEGEVMTRPRGVVVDLFCGVGGLTHGFRQEGFHVAAGYDLDEGCRYAYEYNNSAPFVRADVGKLTSAEVVENFQMGEPRILVGCAPCQPFSSYNQKNDDPKWELVGSFGELIAATKPDLVSMENVPRLLDFRGGGVFRSFCKRLHDAGYHVSHTVAFMPEYGLPQSRSRLVVLASLHGAIHLEPPSVEDPDSTTVESAIGDLPQLQAGDADPKDPLHVASRMSPINLDRIKASRPGGSWKDWDEGLIAKCHQAESGRTYSAVYGRMRWDKPAPTITTQFFGFGNGRFGHPSQDRALSLREGAILQGFPRSYRFVPPGKPVEMKRLGRVIGNAVPVSLGRVIARTMKSHIAEYSL